MRCHAGTEIEGDAVEMIARSRRTIRSALPEAGDIRIAVVPAARALREVAAEQATAGATPLPMTGYKLDLLRGVVHDLLERLV